MFEQLRNTLQPLTNLLAMPFMWIHPNVISIISIFIFLPGMYFYAEGNSLLGTLFILGALFDAVDGTVARKRGISSPFGGVLDATIDRITEGMVLLAIGMGGLVKWEYVFTFFILSIAISYIKAKAEAAAHVDKVGKNKFSVGISQRGDRMFVLFAGSVLNHLFTKDSNDILMYAFFYLIVTSLITLLWRGVVIWKVLDQKA